MTSTKVPAMEILIFIFVGIIGLLAGGQWGRAEWVLGIIAKKIRWELL